MDNVCNSNVKQFFERLNRNLEEQIQLTNELKILIENNSIFTEALTEGQIPINLTIINGIVKVPDNTIVKLPNRSSAYLTSGSEITEVKIISGKGSNPFKPLGTAVGLASMKIKGISTNPEDWYHATGLCYVDIDRSSIKHRITWKAHDDIGAVGRKVKVVAQ